MAKRYESDKLVEFHAFGDEIDFDLYSAAQITDILAADFVSLAEDHAAHYLGEDA